MILGLDLGLQRLHLLLERFELGESLPQAVLDVDELALVGLVLVAEGLVALAQELGRVDALEQLGVLR